MARPVFYAAGRGELTAYDTVELRDLEARTGERRPDGFALELSDGAELSTTNVLLATGMDYRYPDIPGASERWGRSVFHCPFCHGWEVRGRRLAVLGDDEGAVHRALLLTAWSDDIAVLTNGAELPDGASRRLSAAGIEVDRREVASLEGPGSDLESVVFADGSGRPAGVLMVPVTLSRRSGLPDRLGAAHAPESPLTADAVEVDSQMNAGAPGLFAAGDLIPSAPSVPAAIASGHLAAAMIVSSLTGA